MNESTTTHHAPDQAGIEIPAVLDDNERTIERLQEQAGDVREPCEPPDLRGPAIIVTGSVLGGYTFIGPFASIDAAVSHYEQSIHGKIKSPITIALLEKP